MLTALNLQRTDFHHVLCFSIGYVFLNFYHSTHYLLSLLQGSSLQFSLQEKIKFGNWLGQSNKLIDLAVPMILNGTLDMYTMTKLYKESIIQMPVCF